MEFLPDWNRFLIVRASNFEGPVLKLGQIESLEIFDSKTLNLTEGSKVSYRNVLLELYIMRTFSRSFSHHKPNDPWTIPDHPVRLKVERTSNWVKIKFRSSLFYLVLTRSMKPTYTELNHKLYKQTCILTGLPELTTLLTAVYILVRVKNGTQKKFWPKKFEKSEKTEKSRRLSQGRIS